MQILVRLGRVCWWAAEMYAALMAIFVIIGVGYLVVEGYRASTVKWIVSYTMVGLGALAVGRVTRTSWRGNRRRAVVLPPKAIGANSLWGNGLWGRRSSLRVRPRSSRVQTRHSHREKQVLACPDYLR
jgi:hypothetical protein